MSWWMIVPTGLCVFLFVWCFVALSQHEKEVAALKHEYEVMTYAAERAARLKNLKEKHDK